MLTDTWWILSELLQGRLQALACGVVALYKIRQGLKGWLAVPITIYFGDYIPASSYLSYNRPGIGLYNNDPAPKKHGTWIQCCFAVGPPSATVAQQQNNIGLSFPACWECASCVVFSSMACGCAHSLMLADYNSSSFNYAETLGCHCRQTGYFVDRKHEMSRKLWGNGGPTFLTSRATVVFTVVVVVFLGTGPRRIRNRVDRGRRQSDRPADLVMHYNYGVCSICDW